jgi:hypothetical protein
MKSNHLVRAALAGLAFIVALLFSLELAQGQTPWQFKTRFGWGGQAGYNNIRSIYFLDKQGAPQVGFLGLGGSFGGGKGKIVRSNNGGNTWTILDSVDGAVTSYAFKDANNGWLSAQGINPLYRTTDGGNTWNVVASVTGGQGMHIHHLPATVIGGTSYPERLFLARWAAATVVSQDGGATWTPATPTPNLSGFSFSGNGTGIITGANGTAFNYTTDHGTTWNVHTHKVEAWQSTAVVPGGNLYLAASEFDGGLYRSNDGGLTWAQSFQFPSLPGYTRGPTGTIDVSGNRLYLHTSDGFFHSSNQGVSWQDICGPGGKYDMRFYIASNGIWGMGQDSTDIRSARFGHDLHSKVDLCDA